MLLVECSLDEENSALPLIDAIVRASMILLIDNIHTASNILYILSFHWEALSTALSQEGMGRNGKEPEQSVFRLTQNSPFRFSRTNQLGTKNKSLAYIL